MDATRKTVIVTDSSCDLSDEQLSRYGIRMISLRIVCQNAEYRDRIDIQEDELYELLTRELPKTSLPLPEDVSALYESLAQEGVTDVIHISISSGLSGTFNMVRMITQDFESRMRVHMVDSRTLSMGLGMMVLAAARALEEGATPEEAIERAQRPCAEISWACLSSARWNFCARAGASARSRAWWEACSRSSPSSMSTTRASTPLWPRRAGYKSAVDTMVGEVKRFLGGARAELSVVNGKAREEAEKLMERLRSELDVTGETYIMSVSPVLAIHTGPGLLGIVANRADPV